MLLSILIVVLMLAFVATLGLEGVWSALLMGFNILFAGLIAMTLWEPACGFLEEVVSRYGEFFWDFFALMVIFSVSVVVLRTLTDFISPKKVVFPKLVDQIGGPLLAACCGWLFAGFLLTAIQTAPVEPKFFYGAFEPDTAQFLGVASPDAQWRGLVSYVSAGALSPLTAEAESDAHVFDAKEKFVKMYNQRREWYASPKGTEGGFSGILE